MADTSELAKEIVVAWLNTQATNPSQSRSTFTSTNAQQNGEFIGNVYVAVFQLIKQARGEDVEE